MLEHGARVELAGVRARVRRGDEVLNLGPGSLHVGRQPGRLVVELSPGAVSDASLEAGKEGAREEALTFRLALPLDAPGEVSGRGRRRRARRSHRLSPRSGCATATSGCWRSARARSRCARIWPCRPTVVA